MDDAKPAAQFTPSAQQAAFYSWIRAGRGHALVEAVAGAGKTTTLINGLSLMKGDLFFGAFNKRISQEIATKAEERGVLRPGMTIGTMHSAGLRAFRSVAPAVTIEETKTRRLLAGVVARHPEVEDCMQFVCKMVSFGKQLLAGVEWEIDDMAQWTKIMDHFGADSDLPEGADVQRLLKLVGNTLVASNRRMKQMVDFDDMVYAPVLFQVGVRKYDWVLIDEAQDTNPGRRALAKMMLKQSGRLVAVGDRFQAIYGFTGADSDALDRIAKDFNCTRLPLTTTYRCPKSVVKYAQQWVNHIEAAPSAPEGEVRGPRNVKDQQWWEAEGLTAKDAILCRYNRPLVQAAYTLIRNKVPCRIEGRDIGKGLITLIKQQKTNNIDRLRGKLEQYLGNEIRKAEKAGSKTRAQSAEDKVGAVMVFCDKVQDADPEATVAQVVAEIANLFADGVTGCVTLCSIHKGKGREWPRVLWLETSDREGLKDWEIEGERCMKYVAATRAMETLVLVPEAMWGAGV